MCSHTSISVAVQERVQIENGALTIANLSVADAGMFQCVAENKHGLVQSSAELRVTGEPRAAPAALLEALASTKVEKLRVHVTLHV